jgi:hypothetical protein
MATKKATQPTDSRRSSRPSPAKSAATVMSPNRIVAFNLTRARQLRGWTQGQTAMALEPHLGKRWSKASMSQAERSVAGKITRTFDADELVAFSRTFGLPVAWFFMPPTANELREIVGADATTNPGGELVDLVLGDDATSVALSERVAHVLVDLPEGQLTASQRRLAQLTRTKAQTLGDADYRLLETLEAQLREVSNRAGTLTDRLRRQKAHSKDDDATRRKTRPGGSHR